MSLLLSKYVSIKLRRCPDVDGLLASNQRKKKKLYTYERLRRTRRYTAFLEEAFALNEYGTLKGCGQSSPVTHTMDDSPSLLISQTVSSCDDKHEDCSSTSDNQNILCNVVNNNTKSNVDIVGNFFKETYLSSKVDPTTTSNTALKTKDNVPGTSNSECIPVTSIPDGDKSSQNRLKSFNYIHFLSNAHKWVFSSSGKVLKHAGCQPSSNYKKKKTLLPVKLKENANISKITRMSILQNLSNGLQKLPSKSSAQGKTQTKSWHCLDTVRESLKLLSDKFNESPHVLWQCQFCSYSGRPVRIKHHIALKHLAIATNENNLFDCPHCKMECNSEVALRHHLNKVHSVEGMRPCLHCPAMVPYRGLPSHIFGTHIHGQLSTTTRSSISNPEHLPASAPLPPTERLSALRCSPAPARIRRTLIARSPKPSVLSAVSTTMQATGSHGACAAAPHACAAAIHTVAEPAATTVLTHFKMQNPSPVRRKEQSLPTANFSKNKESALIFCSTAPTTVVHPRKFSNDPIDGMHEQPTLSKVNLDAVCIIYQSIKEGNVNHCPLCMFSSTKAELLKHLVEMHLTCNCNDKGEIICPHCDYVCLVEEEYSVHLQTTHNTSYPCFLCDAKLCQHESLLNHLRHHVHRQIAVVEKENAGRVRKKRVLNRIDAKSLHNVYISAMIQRHARGLLTCPLCHYCTSYNSNLGRHLAEVHLDYVRNKSNRIQCFHCRNVFSHEKSYKFHLLVDHSMEFPCPNCSQHFSIRHRLERHLIKHLQPYVKLERIQNVKHGVPTTNAALSCNKEENLPCKSSPLITADLTHTSDSSLHGCPCHVTDIDAESLDQKPSTHDLCSCINGLEEGALKHEPCACTEHAHQKELLEHAACSFRHETQDVEALEHAACSFRHETLTEEPQHVESLKHEAPFVHSLCLCADGAQPEHSDQPLALPSFEAITCPLCNLTCQAAEDFSSHLRKAHQNEAGCYHCSLCCHTEENASNFDYHVFEHINSGPDAYLNRNKLGICNACKQEFEEPLNDFLGFDVLCNQDTIEDK